MRVVRLGTDVRLEGRNLAGSGIAMCRTPIFVSTHGRSGWFNGVLIEGPARRAHSVGWPLRSGVYRVVPRTIGTGPSVGGTLMKNFYGVGAVMTPQAIRLPALPVGSVFMSSGFSWTTMAVPPLEVMLLGEAASKER